MTLMTELLAETLVRNALMRPEHFRHGIGDDEINDDFVWGLANILAIRAAIAATGRVPMPRVVTLPVITKVSHR